MAGGNSASLPAASSNERKVDSPPRYKLVLRVYSAEELQHSSSQGAYCKLYLGDRPMMDGSHKSLNKKDSGESTSSASDAPNDAIDAPQSAEEPVPKVHQVLRTRTQHVQPNALAPPETIWDETFEVTVPVGVDLRAQILSIRVKSQHLFFCPVIGACAVSLANLYPGERLEQWFPLHKGKKAAGRIRVVLLISPDDKPLHARQAAAVARRKRANMDVMAARAASHEADEAIKRLVDKQLRQEAERRQRRLSRGNSQPLVEVKRPSASENQEDAGILDRKLDDLVLGDPRTRSAKVAAPELAPPSRGSASPKMFPPLGTPAAKRETSQSSTLSSESAPSLPPAPVSPISEYERRLDRKLRQVRKETARLRKLKLQLQKYIPDLQTDSDSESDDSMYSDDDASSLSSPSSAASASASALEHQHLGHRHDEKRSLGSKSKTKARPHSAQIPRGSTSSTTTYCF